MIIRRDFYKIYHTEESGGADVCIKTPEGYVLISEQNLDQFLEDIALVVTFDRTMVAVDERFENV